MMLLEADGKRLLAEAGVPVPAGRVLRGWPADGAELPPGPWIVKAQVPTGGRAKAGGVRPADDVGALAVALRDMAGLAIAGHRPRGFLVEQRVAAAAELYLALLLEPATGGARWLVGREGGSEVERGAASLLRADAALDRAAVREAGLALTSRLEPGHAARLAALVPAVTQAFFERDALLVEINPLIVDRAGRAWAADAKVVVDDNALARQPAVRRMIAERPGDYPEAALKLAEGFDFVVVDPGGEIGLLTTGAGLSMMLIDEMRAQGLRPYNFCDIRSSRLKGDAARLARTLGWLREGPRVRVVLVNIFAGITDLAAFAALLIEAVRTTPGLPVVARLVGSGFEAARAAVAASGLAIRLHSELDEALAEAATIARC